MPRTLFGDPLTVNPDLPPLEVQFRELRMVDGFPADEARILAHRRRFENALVDRVVYGENSGGPPPRGIRSLGREER